MHNLTIYCHCLYDKMLSEIKKVGYDAEFLDEGENILSIGYDFFREEGIWKHIGVIVDPSANREPTMLLNGNPALSINEPGISDYHLSIHDPSGLCFYDKYCWRYPYHWWKLTDLSGDDIPDSGESEKDIKMIYDPSNNESRMVFEDSTYLDLGKDLSFNSFRVVGSFNFRLNHSICIYWLFTFIADEKRLRSIPNVENNPAASAA